jgi:hypothetical protein
VLAEAPRGRAQAEWDARPSAVTDASGMAGRSGNFVASLASRSAHVETGRIIVRRQYHYRAACVFTLGPLMPLWSVGARVPGGAVLLAGSTTP